MVRVFKETISTLSEEYVARFSSRNLAVALFRIGKDAGVELEFNKPKNSFTLSGDWINMVKAHNILEEYFKKELADGNYQSKFLASIVNSLSRDNGVVIPVDKSYEPSSPPVLQNCNGMDQTLTHENSIELNNVENKSSDINNDNRNDTDDDDDDDDENNDENFMTADISVNEVTNDELKQEIMNVIQVKTGVNVIDDLDQSCANSKIDDTVINGDTNNDRQDVNSPELPSSTVINVIDTETDTKIQVEVMDEGNTAKQHEDSQLSDNVDGDSVVDNLIMQCEDAEEEETGECNSDSAKVDDQGQDQKFKCDKCNFVAKKKSYVVMHIARRHYERKEFSCHLCNKPFAVKKDLSYHIKDRHPTLSTYCKICDKTFNSLVYFRQHMRIHEDKVSFKCDKCSKTFTSKYSLQNHMKYDHLGLNRRPFTCQTCGKGFAYEKSYLMHQNSHTGRKPYVCDVCGRAFGYEKCLKEHKYIHDENRKFRCELCPQRYKVEESLLNHIAKKHNDAGCICFVCGKIFKKLSYLQQHERYSHTELKEFKCVHCPESFYTISLRTKHMIKRHKLPSFSNKQ